MRRSLLLLLFIAITAIAFAQQSHKLSGTVIGTGASVDYTTGQMSTKVNTKEKAFDGDLNTFFASYARSGTWVGLDLGRPHVITRVGCAPRNDGNGPKRVCLAVFEGAGRPDFLDAVPIYMMQSQGVKTYLAARLKWIDKKLGFDASLVGIDELVYGENFNENNNDDDDSAIYTLSGQKFVTDASTPLLPGVYIKGGRKVIVNMHKEQRTIDNGRTK